MFTKYLATGLALTSGPALLQGVNFEVEQLVRSVGQPERTSRSGLIGILVSDVEDYRQSPTTLPVAL